MCPPELVALYLIQDQLDAELASGIRREDVISNLMVEHQQLNALFPQIPALRNSLANNRAFPLPFISGN